MFTNLVATMAVQKVSNEMAGKIIGCGATTFISKMERGSFNIAEAKGICQYFGKPFEWLFSEDVEIGETERRNE